MFVGVGNNNINKLDVERQIDLSLFLKLLLKKSYLILKKCSREIILVNDFDMLIQKPLYTSLYIQASYTSLYLTHELFTFGLYIWSPVDFNLLQYDKMKTYPNRKFEDEIRKEIYKRDSLQKCKEKAKKLGRYSPTVHKHALCLTFTLSSKNTHFNSRNKHVLGKHCGNR